MRILVLGISGMLGNAMFRVLAENTGLEVYGTLRSVRTKNHFRAELAERIITGIDVENADSLAALFDKVRPQLVVNCIGLIKQYVESEDPLFAIPINSLLPHRLARYCSLIDARLVHVSTDCVFSGRRGNYSESDVSDAEDVYGKSKYIGEVSYANTITLRTSIIGHEIDSHHGLVEWFLNQKGTVHGYCKVLFTGLPTVELSRVVRDFVMPRPELSGVYHVAATPISKHELLKLVAEIYGKTIEIVPDNSIVCDRSLVANRFYEATGYVAPDWRVLVQLMRDYG